MAKQQLPKIPILDLSTKTVNPNLNTSWNKASKDVRDALEEYGFFIALYDDVSSTELEKQVFDALQELFDLPLETKTKNTSELVFYGYVGQLPHAPLHESMGIPEATSVGSVENFTNLMWPNSGNSRFCEAIKGYVKLVSELEQTVDKLVFSSYGAQRHYESHVGSTTYLLRTIKYSAPADINNRENNVGSNAHTDKGFLAILHQNQVDGLEIELANGEWFDVKVPQGAFVVMAGDAYQAWSNGRIYAAKHQVIMKGDKPRYCLAMFSFNYGLTHIPEELVDSEHPLKFKPFDNFGLARYYLTGATQMTESTAEAYCGLIGA